MTPDLGYPDGANEFLPGIFTWSKTTIAHNTVTVDAKRQNIVDSWPADVDDSAARKDWGFQPRYDFARAFDEYLIPTIRDWHQ